MGKKLSLIAAIAITTNFCFAEGYLDDTARTVGRAVGTAAGSVANSFVQEALPDSSIAISQISVKEASFSSENSSKTHQALNSVEITGSDVEAVVALTNVDEDVNLTLENCNGCTQAVTEVTIKSGGKGFSGAYINTTIGGELNVQNINSDNTEQYGNRLVIGRE